VLAQRPPVLQDARQVGAVPVLRAIHSIRPSAVLRLALVPAAVVQHRVAIIVKDGFTATEGRHLFIGQNLDGTGDTVKRRQGEDAFDDSSTSRVENQFTAANFHPRWQSICNRPCLPAVLASRWLGLAVADTLELLLPGLAV